MKIQIDEDCGNAPKKATIRDLLVSLARGEYEKVLAHLADDAKWERAGGDAVTDRERVADLMSQLTDRSATSFTVAEILSHGDRCASCGTYRRADGSRMVVAHFFRFSGHAKNAKIRQVITFVTDTRAASNTSA